MDQESGTHPEKGFVNRDEGSDTLSHTYDRFFSTSHHYRGKNRKKNLASSVAR